MSNKKKKKSGSSAPIFIVIILIIGGVAASNFAGPYKGWMQKQTNSAQSDTGTTATNGTDTAGTTKTPQGNGEVSESKAQKPDTSEADRKYKEFYDAYMADHPEPIAKKKYAFYFNNGSKSTAVLDKIEEFRLAISHVDGNTMRMTVHYSALKKSHMYKFFPKKAAEIVASAKLEKWLMDKNKIIEAPEEVKIASAGPSTSSKPAVKRFSSKKFDPTPAKSSARLAHAALELQNYIEVQARRGTHFAEVGKCHAKQQGASAIYYLYVDSNFANSKRDFKYQTIDGMRRFWALRCMSNGVASKAKAFLCVVYKGKIIGGSKIDNAESVSIK